jgi:hypothetical protein
MMQRMSQALVGVVLSALCVAGLMVQSASPAAAAAQLRVNRGALAPGDALTATGSGFSPQDNVVVSADIVVGQNHQQRASTTVQVAANGTFTASLVIPNGTKQDTYTVSAQDFHNHVATHQFTVYPRAYLAVGKKASTTYIQPNHGFFASGAGFKPGETVRLTATIPLLSGDSLAINKSAQADAKGDLPETFFPVPGNAKAVRSDLTARGAASGRTASSTLVVYYSPSITLNSPYARPGTNIGVSGSDFAPGGVVRVAVTIPRTGSTTETLSKQVTADGRGKFSTSIGLPSDVRLGKYIISATQSSPNLHASASVTVTVHPAVAVKPGSVLPGGAIDVSGGGYGSGSQVKVSATFQIQGGGTKAVTATATTGTTGNFSAQLIVPSNAAPGTVTVNAASSNGQAHATVQVQPAPPTATPTPTNTPPPAATSVPSTPTPTPIGAPPPPPHHKAHLGFRWISIWYHNIRIGSIQHIVVQSSLHAKLAIWVKVYFPSGVHLAFFKKTNNHGKWSTTFLIPSNAFSKNSPTVVVTFRLWHGKKSAEHSSSFNIAR